VTDQPHATYAELGTRPREGDRIIVIVGEQTGWTGRVTALIDRGTAVECRMQRPTGQGSVRIIQRVDAVAKLLPHVPALDSIDDAEAWLAAHDPEPRPAYVEGNIVRFRWKVVGFIAPDLWEPMPAYRVLAVLEGEPAVCIVSADAIID
jgi:hypothetical protein